MGFICGKRGKKLIFTQILQIKLLWKANFEQQLGYSGILFITNMPCGMGYNLIA